MTRRVVVTGIGAITPLGSSAPETWKNALAGKSGIVNITGDWTKDLAAQIAGLVLVDPFEVLDRVSARRMDRSTQLGVIAVKEAWADSGSPDIDKKRLGVFFGTGIGGLSTILEQYDILNSRGPDRVNPMTVPMIMPNSAAAMVGLEVGAQAGVHSPVSACATSAEAIAGGLEMIRNNRADIVVAGGTEACVNRLAIAAFASMRALSTRNNDPEKASRPYDTNRDGFVMAEGAGTLILEEEQHAIKRGAKIYAEVVGYGLSGDAYHMTAPESSGRGSTYAMKLALQHAKINPDQIDYINAHGTSTPLGDEIEIGAIKKVFGDHAYKLSLSSTKSAIGHLLGAAGAVEAIFSIQAIRDNIAPPTLNLEDPSEGCDIDLVANKAKERKIDIVMSNTFGFGGTNGCLILKRF